MFEAARGAGVEDHSPLMCHISWWTLLAACAEEPRTSTPGSSARPCWRDVVSVVTPRTASPRWGCKHRGAGLGQPLGPARGGAGPGAGSGEAGRGAGGGEAEARESLAGAGAGGRVPLAPDLPALPAQVKMACVVVNHCYVDTEGGDEGSTPATTSGPSLRTSPWTWLGCACGRAWA